MTDSKLTRAYRYLRDRIEDGRFAPGHRLVLAAIASELEISVVPVREAIRLLEAEGMVTFQRNIGAQVAMLDAAEYATTFETLTVVEAAAIANAAPHLTAADLARAREINERMRLGVNDFFDPQNFTALNAEFHKTLYEACPNEHLLDLVHRGWNRLGRLRDSVFSFVPERAPHSVDDHAHILGLIEHCAPALEIELAVRAHREATLSAFAEYQTAHTHTDRAATAAE
jgi:DNA-binding GntR family transcriptional regulator